MTCSASCTEPEFVPLTLGGWRGGGVGDLFDRFQCKHVGTYLYYCEYLFSQAVPCLAISCPLRGKGWGALSRHGGRQPPLGCLRVMFAKSLELFETSSVMLLL